MIGDFLDFLSGAVFNFINGIIGILPQMPFGVNEVKSYIGFNSITGLISWVNYFLPINQAATIISLWSAGIIIYMSIKLAIKFTGKMV